MALVIKRWEVRHDGSPSDRIVIEGRRAGLVAWLFDRIGIAPGATLEVDTTRVSLHHGSWTGHVRLLTPLEHVSGYVFGYRRPWIRAILIALIACAALALGIGVAASGRGGEVVAGLVVVAVGLGLLGLAYYVYRFQQTFTLAFRETSGYGPLGGGYSIAFKRSIIEGQSIDEAAGRRVCEIVLELAERRRRDAATGAPPATPTGGASEANPSVAPGAAGAPAPDPAVAPAAAAGPRVSPAAAAAGAAEFCTQCGAPRRFRGIPCARCGGVD